MSATSDFDAQVQTVITGATAAPRVRVAAFSLRCMAGLIDVVILSLVFALLESAVTLLIGQKLPKLSQLGPDYFIDLAVNGHPLAAVAMVVSITIAFLYFFVFHAFLGQTLGKRIMRLAVIDAYGERPTLQRALMRTLAYVPSILLLGLGFIWIGFDREKRALHDWLADTYVVRLRPGRTVDSIVKGTGA